MGTNTSDGIYIGNFADIESTTIDAAGGIIQQVDAENTFLGTHSNLEIIQDAIYNNVGGDDIAF